MASFFGEVLSLSSRAVDDEECENIAIPEVLLHVNERNEKLLSSGTSNEMVLFAIGRHASSFVQAYLLPIASWVTARVILRPVSTDNDAAISGLFYRNEPKTIGCLYESSDSLGILYCVIPDDVPEAQCIPLCQKIFSLYPAASKSVVLTSTHISTYKSDHHFSTLQMPFLRFLATTSYFTSALNSDIRYLEPPNIVTGLPAAVLTESEIMGQASVLFVCYTDTRLLDSNTIEIFETVLNIPWFVERVKVNENAKEKLTNYIRAKQSDDGNLYT